MINHFGTFSGYTINWSKSELIPLGTRHFGHYLLIVSLNGIQIGQHTCLKICRDTYTIVYVNLDTAVVYMD